jgi:hypothetical protein
MRIRVLANGGVAHRCARVLATGAAVGLLGALLPVALDVRIARALQPPSPDWQTAPIVRRGATRLGISFRPPQVAAFGLDLRPALQQLLDYPFDLIRLGAYWNHIEPAPGAFDTSALDWQIDAAERAGKQIILGLGALKNFGYPELFVPRHRLARPLPERTLIRPAEYTALLTQARAFIARIVQRYRDRRAIVAWQVEHEAVDPLGLEHSWRLAAEFVRAEVETVRQTDAGRPVLLNGFLPASFAVRLSQWWQTRDQGDSLAVALRLADTVGLDVYPRHALVGLGPRSVYLDARRSPWQWWRLERVLAAARELGKRVMISEGQAEPWEAATVPPDPGAGASASCPPEQVIDTYNRCLRAAQRSGTALDAYLFWGAEYWVLRESAGDRSFLRAVARVLDEHA